MRLYGGDDLHSNNNYLGIIDEENKIVYKHKLRNEIGPILDALEPFKQEMEGIVVESTYNWYWFVDGLMEHGYRVHLANPAANKQYKGLKHVDDERDALWLANLLRLGILKEGYIYPKEERPVRDLLRKRLQLVRQRTANILSIQNIISRNLGITVSGNDIKKRDNWITSLFADENLSLSVNAGVGVVLYLDDKIRQIEKVIREKVKLRREYEGLLTLPGVGDVLGSTIMLEVGDIRRFPEVGNYSSYCRCVKSIRISNEKSKGKGNSKNGNKYLSWAYVEAAHHARRSCPAIQRYYQRKAAKSNGVIATKAISHKLARASYYIMRDQVRYDAKKLFH